MKRKTKDYVFIFGPMIAAIWWGTIQIAIMYGQHKEMSKWDWEIVHQIKSGREEFNFGDHGWAYNIKIKRYLDKYSR